MYYYFLPEVSSLPESRTFTYYDDDDDDDDNDDDDDDLPDASSSVEHLLFLYHSLPQASSLAEHLRMMMMMIYLRLHPQKNIYVLLLVVFT